MATRVPIQVAQQRQALPVGTSAPRVPLITPTDTTGEALSRLGAGLAQVGDAARRLQEEDDRAWVSKAASDDQLKWMTRLGELKNAAQPGAPDFTPSVLNEFDQYSQEALQSAPPSAKRFYQAQMGQLREYLIRNSVPWQAQQHRANTVDQYEQGLNTDIATVSRDPSAYQERLAARLAVLNSSSLPPDLRSDMARKTSEAMSLAAETAEMQRDPTAWLQRRGLMTSIDPQGGALEISDRVRSFEPDVRRAAAGTGVDPTVLLAQIQAESGGDPSAVSPKGATGLSQFMPDTATRYGVNPSDPQSSIAGQAQYMRDLLKMFDGDYAKAVAGYNWGEGNVQRAIKRFGDNWLSRAPKETRDYVGKVLGASGGSQILLARVGDGLMTDLGESAEFPRSGVFSYDGLSWSAQQRLRERAITLSKQTQVDAQALIGDTVRDQQAAWLSGANYTGPEVSRDQFISAYGASEGAQRWQQHQDAWQTGQDIQMLGGMSAAEQAALLQRRQPAGGPGFAENSRRYAILQNAAETVQRQRAEDPANAVLHSSESVGAAYKDIQRAASMGDMNAMAQASRSYAGRTIGEQRRVGVLQPRILSNGEVARISAEFLDTSEGGRNAAELMDSLQNQWGPYFKDVYAQLATSGKLPPSALVAPNMSDSGAAERLVRSTQPGAMKAYKEIIGPAAAKDIDTDMRKAMSPFLATLINQNGGEGTYEAVRSSAEALAMSYVASGKTARDAVAQAYQETVGHAYQFKNTYRVPVKESPDEVELGVRQLLHDPTSIPAQVFPDLSGQRPEAARAAMNDLLKNSSVLVTDGDEAGLDLFVDQGAGLVPVMGMDGRQINFPWAVLRDIGKAPEGLRRYAPPAETSGGAAVFYRTPGGRP